MSLGVPGSGGNRKDRSPRRQWSGRCRRERRRVCRQVRSAAFRERSSYRDVQRLTWHGRRAGIDLVQDEIAVGQAETVAQCREPIPGSRTRRRCGKAGREWLAARQPADQVRIAVNTVVRQVTVIVRGTEGSRCGLNCGRIGLGRAGQNVDDAARRVGDGDAGVGEGRKSSAGVGRADHQVADPVVVQIEIGSGRENAQSRRRCRRCWRRPGPRGRN